MAGNQDAGLAHSRWARSTAHDSYNNNNQSYGSKLSRNWPKRPSFSSTVTRKEVSTIVSFTGSTPNTPVHNSTRPSPLPTQSSQPNGQSYLDLDLAQKRIPTPWAELARYTKIVRRLQWKLPFLSHGYDCAVNQAVSSAQRAEAELMFKLDFFEYYMLLERALVHLLGVFGIKVTGGFGGSGGDGGDDRQGKHRFHANVLESLDDPANPLHQALGQDSVRSSLARAKELRNRWKNADDPVAALTTRITHGDKAFRPLTDYDLGRILETISDGFDGAFHIADSYVTDVRAFAGQRGIASDVDAAREQADEWEFMVDAMDWEAV